MLRSMCFGLALGAAVLMTGCMTQPSMPPNTGRQAPSQPETSLRVGIVFDSGGRGDKSFNDSAWAGIERAKQEFRIDEQQVQSRSEKDYATNIEALAQRGVDIVFAIGINMRTAILQVAPKYPRTKFAIVDANVDLPNVKSLLFKEEEGSFLAGYLAGLTTTTGKIGFVGGMDLPLIRKFESGFHAGALTARRDVTFLPPKYTGDWNNIDTAKAAANVLFETGADIVYHAAGRAGLGVIRAAEERGKYAIGVDSDQDYLAPGRVLTSMIKRVDEAVFQTIKEVRDGKFTAGATYFDLKSNGVGLSAMEYTKDAVGPERMAKVQAIAEQIKTGELVVPTDRSKLDVYVAQLR